MIYLNNLLHYLVKFCDIYNIYFLLYIFLCLQLYFIYILMKKKETTDLKIYNFDLNNIFIDLYIFVFVILICILRYIRWGYTINLKDIYINFLSIYYNYPKILFIILILLVLICFLILIKLKHFFYKEILKKHLYIYDFYHMQDIKELNKKFPNKLFTTKDFCLYVQIIHKLKKSWNFDRIIERIIFYYIITPYCKFFKTNDFSFIPKNTISIFIKKSPFIILFSLILYDCLLNNYNIHLIFYFLPFYFIFCLWENTCDFLLHTNQI